MSQLLLGRDLSGAVDYGLPPASYTQKVTLAAGIEQHFTTPQGYNTMFVTSSDGVDIFLAIGTTASLPSGSFSQSVTEMNPSVRNIDINGGQLISVISFGTPNVVIRLDTV